MPSNLFPMLTYRIPTLLAFLTFAVSCLAEDTLRKPNIIYILSDDLGYGELSCYGQRRYQTPNIDRMAEEGLLFTDHYAGSPICAPSRNTIMTGQHTGHATVRNNFLYGGDEGDRVPLAKTDLTIAQRLSESGYETALIGKWGLGEVGSGSEPWKKGWDLFYGFVNQKHAHNQFPEFLYRNETIEPIIPNYGFLEQTYANDLFTDEALSFIERRAKAESPFFLYLAYTTPHAKLNCPEDSLEEAARKYPELAGPDAPDSALTFAAMVLRLDRDVGRILSQLAKFGIDENTLVIFTSDNGPHAEDGKENDYFQASGPLRGIKRDLYEGGIRVPCIARWPGTIEAGQRTRHPSAFWDFPATALELAGVAPDAGFSTDGISFAPTLRGEETKQSQHEYLYWELIYKKQGRQALRMGDWKAVRYGVDSPIELYNLAEDIAESKDLASNHPGLAAKAEQLFVTARTADSRFPLDQD